MLTLILAARTYCEDYDQDIPDDYSSEDDSESGYQVSKYASTRISADHHVRGKAKRFLNKTIIQESDENNDLSRNSRTNDGNVNIKLLMKACPV